MLFYGFLVVVYRKSSFTTLQPSATKCALFEQREPNNTYSSGNEPKRFKYCLFLQQSWSHLRCETLIVAKTDTRILLTMILLLVL